MARRWDRPSRPRYRSFDRSPLLRAFGEFSVWQSDYHIKLISIGGGTLKLKDELKLKFDIGARRLRDPEADGGS